MTIEEQLAAARRENEALRRLCASHEQRAAFAESMLNKWTSICVMQAAIASKLAGGDAGTEPARSAEIVLFKRAEEGR